MGDPAADAGIGEPSSLRAQLVQAARGSVLVRLFALGLTFASSIVLARALGVTGFGVYAFVFAVVNLLALPSQVGIPTLLVRETAKWAALGKWSTIKGLWLWSSRVIITISLVIAAVSTTVLWLRSARLGHDLFLTLVAGLALMPLLALGVARGAALRGLRLIVRGQLPETIIRPLLLIVLVGAAWSLGTEVSPQAAMGLHVAAAAASFAIGAVILWRSRPPQVAMSRADLALAPEWRSAILPLTLISGLQVVSNQTGVVLLGLFRPEAEAGLFKIATSAAMLGLFGQQTITLIVSPHFARLYALGEMHRIQKLASLGALAGTVMTVPFFVGFLVFGRELLGFVYGPEYVDAYLALVIVSAGQLLNASFGPVGALLHMGGKERDAARWLLLSTAANVAVGLAFVPLYGTLGAALATTASIAIWNVAFWVQARRKVGIDGSVYPALLRWFRR